MQAEGGVKRHLLLNVIGKKRFRNVNNSILKLLHSMQPGYKKSAHTSCGSIEKLVYREMLTKRSKNHGSYIKGSFWTN
jgi:hypothetical protein